jgi:signal peptidase I
MLPVGLTLIFVLILRFVLLVGYVPTPSMEPTLRQNSIIVGTRLFGELKTGDIIVFQKDGVLVVKRIAGCPGERIDLTKISYMESVPIPIFEQEVITVPKNAYFVLGDNSQNSWDSRYWEDPFISADDIVAKLLGY